MSNMQDAVDAYVTHIVLHDVYIYVHENIWL